MQKLKFLYPDFLRRADRYLLLNYPHVWRTRVHEFGWFSLILGNVLAVVLGILMARTRYGINAPHIRSDGMYALMNISLPTPLSLQIIRYALCLVLLLWFFKLRQFKIPQTSRRHVFLTWFIYIGCILSLHLNVATFIVGNAIGTVHYKSPPIEHLHTDFALFEPIEYDPDCFSEYDINYLPMNEDYFNMPLLKECYEKITPELLERYKDLTNNDASLLRRDVSIILSHNYSIIKAREFLYTPFKDLSDDVDRGAEFYRNICWQQWIFLLLSSIFIPTILFFATDFRRIGLFLLCIPILTLIFLFKLFLLYNGLFYTGIIAFIACSFISIPCIHGYLKQKDLPNTT